MINNKKGAFSIDFAIGILMLIVGTVATLKLYESTALLATKVRNRQIVMDDIVAFCENIDRMSFREVVNKSNLNVAAGKAFGNKNVDLKIQQPSNKKDIVIIKFTVPYYDSDHTITMRKVKHKEL